MCVGEMDSAMEMAKLFKDPKEVVIPLAKAFTKALERHGKNTEEKIRKQADFCMSKWQELHKSNEELRSEMVQFKAESMADRQSLREDIAELKSEVLKSLEKASKWKALTDMLTACFGTVQDTIKTLLIIGFFVGAVHLKDIIDLVKMIV